MLTKKMVKIYNATMLIIQEIVRKRFFSLQSIAQSQVRNITIVPAHGMVFIAIGVKNGVLKSIKLKILP